MTLICHDPNKKRVIHKKELFLYAVLTVYAVFQMSLLANNEQEFAMHNKYNMCVQFSLLSGYRGK